MNGKATGVEHAVLFRVHDRKHRQRSSPEGAQDD
jgi:hypothetical protein